MEFEKQYEPQKFEPHWAQLVGRNRHLSRRSPPRPGPVFSIVIPPPNVTGSLHMGHMLDHTIMDAAVRWHRMRGDNTLWLPGVDHAGIATQMMVERMLAEEGITRQQLGREEFEQRVWEWKEKYGDRITEQMKQIGDSVDWSREQFHAFARTRRRWSPKPSCACYERGLIYRGTYMVNWCPRCQTAISDLETVHEETQGSLWHIRYPVTGTDRFLTVATTRPETMLGDTAVAINAKDARYFDLHGKTVTLPLMDREIPIILDDLADPAFGSGAVKVTPAHDPNDFEVGKRHNLPSIQVIDQQARMTAAAGPYAGLDRFEARKRIVADLEKLGLLEKIEPHTLAHRALRPLQDHRRAAGLHAVVCEDEAARRQSARKPLEDGSIRFVPENWNNTYLQLDEQHPRLVHLAPAVVGPSHPRLALRQLPGDHRGARPRPTACAHCGSDQLEQDPDVLDTWFSSGLWPFSTLGWPDETVDLRTYYPTSLLITGFDILFFWVARMIMLGLELTGQAAVPRGPHARPGARCRTARRCPRPRAT